MVSTKVLDWWGIEALIVHIIEFAFYRMRISPVQSRVLASGSNLTIQLHHFRFQTANRLDESVRLDFERHFQVLDDIWRGR